MLTPELFFKLCLSQGYIQNFGRNWKYSIFIRVNIFAKSVNFIGSSKKKKNWNCQNLNTTPYVGKLTLVKYTLLIFPFTVFEE